MTEKPKGLLVNIVKAENDGVGIIIDTTEVYDGGEQVVARLRLVSNDPVEALECVSAALWPLRKFHIFEVESDEVPQ